MKTSNPFQIPACLQRADLQQRRRERFRNGFMAALAVHVVLFAVLLIQGCKTGKTAFTEPTEETFMAAAAPAPAATVVTPPKVSAPVTQTQPTQVQPAVAASAPALAPAVSDPATVYVVQRGDTLTRIAKVHNSTISAIKAANHMTDDRLQVGAKLKIPQA